MPTGIFSLPYRASFTYTFYFTPFFPAFESCSHSSLVFLKRCLSIFTNIVLIGLRVLEVRKKDALLRRVYTTMHILCTL